MHVIVLWVAAAVTSEYDGGDAFLCTFFTIRSTTTIKSDIVHKRAARVLPLELFNASFFLLCGKPFITKRSRSFFRERLYISRNRARFRGIART